MEKSHLSSGVRRISCFAKFFTEHAEGSVQDTSVMGKGIKGIFPVVISNARITTS